MDTEQTLQIFSPRSSKLRRLMGGGRGSTSRSHIVFLSVGFYLIDNSFWVKNPESIVDHMYRMGLMALICTDIPEINRDKCIKMAIVHDIAEAIVGDITPSDGIRKHEKNRREREALEHMCKLLGGGPRAKEIDDLWMEYEENSTPEAKIVKDFDKIEMILQALEYENEKELRSDPAYLSYYYSNVNLNPRLPLPLLSKEDWQFAQRLQGGNSTIGDRRKVNRIDTDGVGRSMFSMPPGFNSKNQESEIEMDNVQGFGEWGVDGLIGRYWNKQLTVAKEAQRVDIMCYKIFLSYRLLDGTSRFEELHEFIKEAKAKLEICRKRKNEHCSLPVNKPFTRLQSKASDNLAPSVKVSVADMSKSNNRLEHMETDLWMEYEENSTPEAKIVKDFDKKELRSDPAYLSYYYSNVNLNPRLPPPLLSKEDWQFAQRLQGGNSTIGDRRKVNRIDTDGVGRSMFSMPPGFNSKNQESETEMDNV
ncbi:unnamed protein product [Fraxinus pennsylvanica]|uniref:5'-deoxynucleotidase n=1 Tax=Fraxinus pennsylvanica TaxID=56036 RepID=A0AAD2A651_9LAMI|nr:unnamed protein product [Fraxinus pennsylvanica]